MPFSVSSRMQAILECQSQKILWIIECPHSCIDGNWNIVRSFGEKTKISNLLASELDLLENYILSGEFANGCWDAEFGEACQGDLESNG
jgi:hypothetical protein